MFDEFLRNCPPEGEIKPSKKRVKKNIAALKSLIETEGSSMTKRKFRFKPLVIAAVITLFSTASLVIVNASMKGGGVNFRMGGEEIEGEFNDYVDGDGYRHVSFSAVLPIYEANFAIIYDVDAPQGENVRVITDETDPEFMDKLRRYREAIEATSGKLVYNTSGEGFSGRLETVDLPPKPEDFGLVFKDSEICTFSLGYIGEIYTEFNTFSGELGGEFMHTGAAYGKPAGTDEINGCSYDWENEIKTYTNSFYYYVGKD